MVRAAVVRTPGGDVRIEDVDLPGVGPGQVRVRLRAAGVCHSDLSLARGTLRQPMPAILGHEGSGVVVETGPGVVRPGVGAAVVLCWAPPCRACPACRRGEPYLCSAAQPPPNPAGRLADGTAVHLSLGTGAFAEETIVPARAAIELPAGCAVPLDLAALVGCAVATGVGAVVQTARVQPGETVVVVGAGGVGLSCVQGARLAGASRIAVVDPDPGKRELAGRLGATAAFPPGDDLARALRDATDADGADHAFEAVGTAATIRTAWAATRRGGHVTVVGIGGRDESVTFSALELFHFARSLSVSVYGSTDPDRDFPRLLGWAATGELDLAALVTRRISLDGVPGALADLEAGQGVRALVEFPGSG